MRSVFLKIFLWFDKIFLPFHKVEGVAATEGAGLGLAITERIVRSHGGNVRATNAPDGGLIVDGAAIS